MRSETRLAILLSWIVLMLCIHTWFGITSKQIHFKQPISQGLKYEHTHELGWPIPFFILQKNMILIDSR